MTHQLLSADDHMDLCYLPPDLWQKRLPDAWRDAAPKVVKTPDGDVWTREGNVWGIYGSKRADGRKVVFDQVGLPEEPEPGTFRPSSSQHRLKDMDLDNTRSQIIYGPVAWGFSDEALKSQCVKAYNSWLGEEFCNVSLDRLVGLAVLPAHEPQAAVDELYRVAALGLRGAVFDVFGSAAPIFDEVWDPLWSAGEETGMVLSVHIGGGFHTLTSGRKSTAGTWRQAAGPAVIGMQLDEILVGILMCGMLERHPKLTLVLGESGIGWIPFVLERVAWEQKNYKDLVPALRNQPDPKTLFHRNVFATFQEEELGIRLIPEIGVDNVMWASDYPHADGTFPHSMEAVQQMFSGVSPEIIEKVTYENVRRLYGLPHEADVSDGGVRHE